MVQNYSELCIERGCLQIGQLQKSWGLFKYILLPLSPINIPSTSKAVGETRDRWIEGSMNRGIDESRDRWIEAWIEGEASASPSLFFLLPARSSNSTRYFEFRKNSNSILPSIFPKSNSNARSISRTTVYRTRPPPPLIQEYNILVQTPPPPKYL